MLWTEQERANPKFIINQSNRRGNFKIFRKIIAAFTLVFIIFTVSCSSDIENFEPKEDNAKSVTIKITGEKGDLILQKTKVKIKDGYTCFDVTKYITRKNGIAFVYSGMKETVYVRGINGIFELSAGPSSGWIYKINDSFSDTNKSCGAYVLSDKDTIEWFFTDNLGKSQGFKNNS